MKTTEQKTPRPLDCIPYCFIIVCNFSSEKNAAPLEKAILRGFTNKWIKKHNDPQAQRLHIIYWDPEDTTDSERFSVLAKANPYSEIIIVGHSQPGAGEIRSNPIPVYKPEKDKYEHIAKKLSFFELGSILFYNIKDKRIVRERHLMPENNPQHNKLKIYVSSCNSAVSGKNADAPDSFCDQLFSFLMDGSVIMDCDIVGTNGITLPIPIKPNWNILEFWHLLRGNFHALGEGFHERFLLVNEHKLPTVFPRYKTQYARTTFVTTRFVESEPAKPTRINPVEAKLFREHRREMHIVLEATQGISQWPKVVVAERNRAMALAVDFLKNQQPIQLHQKRSQWVELIREKISAAIYVKTGHFRLLELSLGIRFAKDLFSLTSASALTFQ